MTTCPKPLHWTKVSTRMRPVTQVAEVAVKRAVRKPQDSPLREATGRVSKSAPVRMMAAKANAMMRVVESRLELTDKRSRKRWRTYDMKFPPKYPQAADIPWHIRLFGPELGGQARSLSAPPPSHQSPFLFVHYSLKEPGNSASSYHMDTEIASPDPSTVRATAFPFSCPQIPRVGTRFFPLAQWEKQTKFPAIWTYNRPLPCIFR